MSDRQIEVRDNRIRELEEENLRLTEELETYRRDSRHVIELRDDGWTIQHPLSCRPNLFECIYNFAAADTNNLIDQPRGRFYVTIDDPDQMLVIGAEAP